MASILLVLKHAELDRHNAEVLARFAHEAAPGVSARGATAAGDERRLRGIPALAPGVSGAMRGTLPHIAIERLDRPS